MDSGGDPTYEMACVRRYITGTESIGQFIENSRKMFLLQVNNRFISQVEKFRFLGYKTTEMLLKNVP